jgi:hypothetical protein
MHPLLTKLQFREGRVVVVRPPSEFAPTQAAWTAEGVRVGTRPSSSAALVLTFVRSCADIAARAPQVLAAAPPDALLWFAYPKKSSPRYASDVGRDDSWQPLGDLGFEAVRQIAIDEDWSALRFRRAQDIRAMTRDRSRRISSEGRARA